MKIIAGLGNPGYEYHLTPHNLGFMAADRLAEICGAKFSQKRKALVARAELEGEAVLLVKPQTFMNLSGVAISSLLKDSNAGPEDLMVLVDDVDLPIGFIRVRQKGSAGGHNGLKSIIGTLGTDQFVRIRIGARPEKEKRSGDLIGHVLSPFRRAQLEAVADSIEQAAEATRVILREGPQQAMNRFNRKVPLEEL